MQYKISVSDRNYNKYEYLDSKTLKKVDPQPPINPLQYNLFNQDIIEYSDNNCKIVHSSIRSTKLSGVLVLEDNIRHGSIGNNRNMKYLYKCIPDDKRLPEFLIPYKIKLAFHKKIENIYIIFEVNKWNYSVLKFPLGTCLQNLGSTKKVESFYEYQLYCKSLYSSITKFNKDLIKKLKEKSQLEYINTIKKKYKLEDRTIGYRKNIKIFSIDPDKSKDFDDAFSIWFPNGSKVAVVTIYIANVALWLDVLNLWDSFSNRISTIYLPDRKRPMLPTILSDSLCSLQRGDKRFAFAVDLFVEKDTGKIINHIFKNTMIQVDENLRYDSKTEEKYENYHDLLQIVKKMNKEKKYLQNINSSHDMVAYLMITMNYLSALKLKENKKGIYRSSKFNKNYKPPEKINEDIQKFLKLWHSFGGKYCKYENIDEHEMLELDAYVHMTSPIRRLIDLLNSIDLMKICNMAPLSENAYTFYNKWTTDENISYINTTMRSIRKVQNDCSLLNICVNDPEVLKKTYEGYIFDKIIRNDKLYQYMVFIPELKMTNRLTSRYNMENYLKYNFKIYIFIDEIRLKQKIRIELIQ